ncbi:unnamed protein product, partial [marine sediment metagenome]
MTIVNMKRSKPKKRIKRSTLKNKCDALWRKIIHSKGKCERCPKPGTDAHHVIGRGNYNLRWDIRNGCLLCASCHEFSKNSAKNNPLLFAEWFKLNRPDDYIYLMRKRNEIWDKDYDKVLEYLQEVKK